MRPFYFLLVAGLLPLGLHAQQPGHYGKLGVIAVSSTSGGERIATDVGKTLTEALKTDEEARKRELTLSGNVKTIHGTESIPGALDSLAKDLGSGHIALIEYESQNSSGTAGVVIVEMFEVLRGEARAAQVLLAELMTVAKIRVFGRLGGATILQNLSNGKTVAVALSISTKPGEAIVIFGGSQPERTDRNGELLWTGTKPAGRQTLIVSKPPDYQDDTRSVEVIPPRVPDTKYFRESVVVELKPSNTKKTTTKTAPKE
jgi:hypothetical protein